MGLRVDSNTSSRSRGLRGLAFPIVAQTAGWGWGGLLLSVPLLIAISDPLDCSGQLRGASHSFQSSLPLAGVFAAAERKPTGITYAKEDLLKGHCGQLLESRDFAKQTQSRGGEIGTAPGTSKVGKKSLITSVQSLYLRHSLRSTYAQRLRPRKALEASSLLSTPFQHPAGKWSLSSLLIKITPVDASLS